MDLVALLTEIALKFASLPGSRLALLVCHIAGDGEQAGAAGHVFCLVLGLESFLEILWGRKVVLCLIFCYIYGESALLLSSPTLTKHP